MVSARTGAQQLHRYATSLGLPEFEDKSTFYLYWALDPAAEAFARLHGTSVEDAKENIERWPFQAGYKFIFINLKEGDSIGLCGLTRIAAHEMVHVHQQALTGFGNISTPHDTVRVTGPSWLEEGFATFRESRALAASSTCFPSYEQWRADFVDRAERIDADTKLEDLETVNGLFKVSGSYSFSALAVELLVSSAGEGKAIEYWTLLGPGKEWQEAFQTTFGMTVADFYVLFKKHREDGFPELDLN